MTRFTLDECLNAVARMNDGFTRDEMREPQLLAHDLAEHVRELRAELASLTLREDQRVVTVDQLQMIEAAMMPDCKLLVRRIINEDAT